jgi:hypothetical protein
VLFVNFGERFKPVALKVQAGIVGENCNAREKTEAVGGRKSPEFLYAPKSLYKIAALSV